MNDAALHDRSTIALLERLGLSRNEVRCYLAALTLGPVPVSELAQTARVHRVNAYGAVRSLTTRGLVEQEVTSRGRRIHAAPLERIVDFARDQQKASTKLRWRVEELIPMLRGIARNTERAQLFRYDGPATIANVLERELAVTPPGSEMLEICLFVDGEPREALESQTRFITARLERQCSKRLLCLRSREHQDLIMNDATELRETRFLPEALAHGTELCDVNIYADEVAMYWDGPPTAIVVKGTRITNVMRMLFNMAWGVAERSTPHGSDDSKARRRNGIDHSQRR